MESDRIVCNPKVLGGKPAIKGTRISVDLVLQYVEQDLNADDVLAAYPHIIEADVRACISYARSLVQAESRRGTAASGIH
jgi:uncharacterized protein (DUF433 family)